MKRFLIFGGRSDERLVSVASAQGLIANFEFDAQFFFASSGVIHSVSREDVLEHERPFEVEFKPRSQELYKSLSVALPAWKGHSLFIGLHGTEGEDGTLQAQFDQAGLAYTGSDARSSLLCFDKQMAKRVVEAAGIRTAREVHFHTRDVAAAYPQLRNLISEVGKVAIKPTRSGSSFGLFVVDRLSGLDNALARAAATPYGSFIAEEFISGRELTVGALTWRGQLRALPPSEIKLERGANFDYEGKYLGKAIEITPAQLTSEDRDHAEEMAIKAHQVLGCFGYSRTDMILTPDGPCFLETNTLPGLTKMSFIPQQLKSAGIDLGDFVEDQLELAEQRLKTQEP